MSGVLLAAWISSQALQWTFSIIYLLLLISTIIVVFLEDQREPSSTMAWLLVLIFLPAIGLVLYYVFGQTPRIKREEPFSYDDFRYQIAADFAPDKDPNPAFEDHSDKILPAYLPLVKLLSQRNDARVNYGSDIEVITSGQRKFQALYEDLENAKHHIHIEYFYFRKDATGKRVREILMRKASEGVEVRFIYENIANIDISPRYYYAMEKAGVQVVRFSKITLPWARRQLNFRDHRKIVVIDGKIGYTGGMNIGDEYAEKWRDTHLRILGQGVHALQSCFLYTWCCSGGKHVSSYSDYFPEVKTATNNLMQIVSESPASEWPYLLLAMVHIVSHTQKYIYIQTPYYLPSGSLLQALQTAALQGVDVRIMVPRKSDFVFMDYATHAYYDESLKAGIRIYEYQDCFIHAKSLVADDYLSVIGSANMDFRSLELSFEINAYMYDPNIAAKNKALFMEDMEHCKEVLYEAWKKRPWWQRIFESVMRLLSPLL